MNNYDPMLVIASATELPAERRVWGTGGWVPAEQREALDWLTLTRLSGWGVTVRPQRDSISGARLSKNYNWVIIACDPDQLSEELIALLASKLDAEPLLVVARAAAPTSSFAQLAGAARSSGQITGRSLRWIGPGAERRWHCRNALDASGLGLSEGTHPWATLDDAPLIAARPFGQGVVATLGFHPSEARDTDGAATALLRHLLIYGSSRPVAWLDFEGTLVLRMDDPGGAQNVYSRNWSYPKLGEREWAAIGTDLKRRQARVSIGYVSGWVDDGDAERGMLRVAGQAPRRIPGQIYPSPLIKYMDEAGHSPGTLYDYQSEFRGIQSLRAAGLGEVELHGYTHMHPDAAKWAQAPDRYDEVSWFRELGKVAEGTIAARPPGEHPLALGIAALRQYFGVHPTTLIAPGDQWTDTVLERALDLGLHLVSSYYLAIRDHERFCWSTHICAPYLDEPDAAWFDSGLAVVGYFHDHEPALEGVSWMSRWLDRWQEAGAQRIIDFRELAAAVSRRLYFEEGNGQLRLKVTNDGSLPLARPLLITMHLPGRQQPDCIPVLLGGKDLSLKVGAFNNGTCRLTLPVV